MSLRAFGRNSFSGVSNFIRNLLSLSPPYKYVLRVPAAVNRLVLPPVSCGCIHQNNIRWMSRKKQPNQASEKEKWVPRNLKHLTKKKVHVTPNNWDKFLKKTPEDDVWIKTHFPPIRYSLEDAIHMHREVACPEMLDNMDGVVYLNAQLDMKTNKKTKFISAFSGIITVPHYFDDGSENKVLAFCRTKDEQKLALAEGASFAGGAELMALIESGEVRNYMFDLAVCTLEFYDDITKARKHIRDKFPNKRSGSIGEDIATLVRQFRFGKNYSCTKEIDEVGVIKVPIGKLDMPTSQLLDNLTKFVETINSHRPGRISAISGPFINKVYVTCPPSGEKVYLIEDEYIPQSRTKSKQKSVEDPEAVVEDEPSQALSAS